LSEHGVSFIVDNVILLRLVERSGKMGRAISIMKMRGSQHNKEIREFKIASKGFHIGAPILALTGVLTGTPTISDSMALGHFTLRAHYILESLKQMSSASLADLSRFTRLSRETLLQELEDLQQQNMVITIKKGDRVHYKTTV